MNLPPEIVLPDSDPGVPLPLVLESDPTILQVVAQDPEGDDLYLHWEVPHDAFERHDDFEEGGSVVSIVYVEVAPLEPGDTITCSAIDSEAHVASVSWTVEEP